MTFFLTRNLEISKIITIFAPKKTTLYINMQYIHLEEINSTNSYLLAHPELEEGTVVYTMRQTAGRGQMGNTWESEADKNISFSIQLKPTWLAPKDQFLISQVVSLAIATALSDIARAQNKITPTLSIKWPNDIYAGDEKVCGILIENSLQGSRIAQCVVGIGINVNQEVWRMGAPNPTSLRLLGIDTTPEDVLKAVVSQVMRLYGEAQDKAHAKEIRNLYIKNMYRNDGLHPYKDATTGEVFIASIKEVDSHGPLVLVTDKWEERRYWFKEVKFIHPNGLVKE